MSPVPYRNNGFTVGMLGNLRDDINADIYIDAINRAQNPPQQQQQEQGINWLNAAGLGALAAGLGALGYAGYKNRGRLMPKAPPAPERPAARPTPEPTPPPTSGPRGSAAQATPAGPSVDPVAAVLASLENDPEVQQYIKYRDQAAELGGVRRVDLTRDPQTGRVAPTFVGGVVPQEAARQSQAVRGRNVIQDRIDAINNQRQYQRDLRQQADAVRKDLLSGPIDINEGRPSTVRVTDLNTADPQVIDSVSRSRDVMAALQRAEANRQNFAQTRVDQSADARLQALLNDAVERLTEERRLDAAGVRDLSMAERSRMAGQELISSGNEALTQIQREGLAQRQAHLSNLDAASYQAGRARHQRMVGASQQTLANERDVMGLREKIEFDLMPPLVNQRIQAELLDENLKPRSDLAFGEYANRVEQIQNEVRQSLYDQHITPKLRQLAGDEELDPMSADQRAAAEAERARIIEDGNQQQAAVDAVRESRQRKEGNPNAIATTWSDELKNSIFDQTRIDGGAKVLRLKPQSALTIATSFPDVIDDQTARVLATIGNPDANPNLTKRERFQIKKQIAQGQTPDLSPEQEMALDMATHHVMKAELFNEDYNGTIANFVAQGGDLQPLSSKGLGYTVGTNNVAGRGFNVTPQEGQGFRVRNRKGQSAQMGRSDLVNMIRYDDPATGETLIGTANELGISTAADPGNAAADSGLGNTLGVTLGFVPRNKYIAQVAVTPGAAASGPMPEPGDLVQRIGDNTQLSKDVVANDFAGEYVGGIRGFYADRAKSNKGYDPNDPNLRTYEIYGTPNENGNIIISGPDIAQAKDDGVIELRATKSGDSQGKLYPNLRIPTGLYTSSIELADAAKDLKPGDTFYGITKSGIPRTKGGANSANPWKYGTPGQQFDQDLKLLTDYNNLSSLYNNQVDQLRSMLAQASLPSSKPVTGLPIDIYDRASAAEVNLKTRPEEEDIFEDSRQNNLGPTFTKSVRDKVLANNALNLVKGVPIDPSNPDSELESVIRPVGNIVELGSANQPYRKVTRVQAPVAEVNDLLTLALADIQGANTPRNRERLAALPPSYDTQEKRERTIAERLDLLGSQFQQQQADRIRSLGAERAGRELEASDQAASAALDLLLKGDLTPQQQSKLAGLNQTIENAKANIAALDPESADFNPEIAGDSLPYKVDPERLLNRSAGESIDPLEAQARLNNTIDEYQTYGKYGSGFYPARLRVSDQADYNYASPIVSRTNPLTGEKYTIQEGGTVNWPAYMQAVQDAQVAVSKNQFGASGARSPQIDAAIRLSEMPQLYRYSPSNNPITLAGKMAANTLTQVKDIKPSISYPDQSDALTRGSVVSNYSVSDVNRLIGDVDRSLEQLDGDDPRVPQLQAHRENLMRDLASLKPAGSGPLDLRVRSERDPKFRAALDGDVIELPNGQRLVQTGVSDAKVPVRMRGSRPAGVLSPAQAANLYANEVSGNRVDTSLAQQLIDQAKSNRIKASANAATQRPGSSSAPGIELALQPVYDRDGRVIGQEIGDVNGNPMASLRLSRKDVLGIQQPGGVFRPQVQAAADARRSNLASFLQTAQQTPGGRMVLGSQSMAMGPAPGDVVGYDNDANKRPMRTTIASRPQGSLLQPATVQLGPMGMAASQTISQYGLTPAQLSGLGNLTMNRSALDQDNNLALRVARASLDRRKEMAAKQPAIQFGIPGLYPAGNAVVSETGPVAAYIQPRVYPMGGYNNI